MKRNEFQGLRGQSYGDKRVEVGEPRPVSAMISGIVVATIVVGVLLAIGSCSKAHGQDPVAATFGPPKRTADPLRAQKRELGRMLYHDPRVGTDVRPGNPGTSCATCHSLSNSGSDGHKLAVGRKGARIQIGNQIREFPNGLVGNRHTPSNWNAEHRELHAQFADGRAKNLRAQALGPIANPDEMGTQTPQQMCNRLNRIAGYRQLVEAAYGVSEITPAIFADSVSIFQVDVLRAVKTPLTLYLNGDESALVTQSAKRGAALFKKHCVECHPAPYYTTGLFANTGVEYLASTNDIGLQRTTGKPEDERSFKIPGLVGVPLRAPYGHNGAVPTLERMVEHYGRGGRYTDTTGQEQRDPKINATVAAFNFDKAQQADIVACIKEGLVAYDAPRAENVVPKELPR